MWLRAMDAGVYMNPRAGQLSLEPTTQKLRWTKDPAKAMYQLHHQSATVHKKFALSWQPDLCLTIKPIVRRETTIVEHIG
jgi:hypothetical protein